MSDDCGFNVCGNGISSCTRAGLDLSVLQFQTERATGCEGGCDTDLGAKSQSPIDQQRRRHPYTDETVLSFWLNTRFFRCDGVPVGSLGVHQFHVEGQSDRQE